MLAALGLPLERAGRIGTEVAEGLLFLVVAADLLAWAAGDEPEEPSSTWATPSPPSR